MRTARSVFAILLLLALQVFCVLPGQRPPTQIPGATAVPTEVTTAPAQGIHLGRCYRLNVAQWASVLAVDTRVQVMELSANAAQGAIDATLRVLA